MNKYDVAYKTGIYSFITIIVFLVAMNFLPISIAMKAEESAIVQGFSTIIGLLFSISGLFLWVTGFKRFQKQLSTFGSFFMYVSFNILSAFYLHHRMKNVHKSR
jgi:hypothetical protein